MKKRYIFLSVLAIIIAGVYFFAPSLESIVQKIVHKYGSEITGTDVNLKGFKLGLANGEGSISEITVGNPKGYDAKNIFELGNIYVKVDIKSLTSDTIIIEDIEVSKPIINYEMLSLTRNNITDIQENIKKNTAKSSSAKTEDKAEESKSEDTAASKKVIIKKLSIKDGEINAIVGKEEAVSVKLPTITMTNIGEDKKGESITTSISKIIGKILTTASNAVVNSKISDLKGVAEKNLEDITGGVKDRIKSIGIFGK